MRASAQLQKLLRTTFWRQELQSLSLQQNLNQTAALQAQQQPQSLLPTLLRQYAGGFARIAETEKGNTKFSGFYKAGFYVNNVQVPGSVLASTDIYMLWKPRRISEVTPESLVFLEIIKPAPEVLVLGTGLSPAPIPKDVQQYLENIGVMVEVLDSRNATGYFNVLNDDGRAVVGALLTMDPDAPSPEVMPEMKEPLWERGSLLNSGGNI